MTIDLDAIRALVARRDTLADWSAGVRDDDRWKNLFALADEVPGLVAEVEFLRAREEHFAAALGVADGGQYRNDWDGALRRLVAERDRLQAELDAGLARLIEVIAVIDRLALGHPGWVEYHALRATQGWDGDADLFHARVVAIQSGLEAADRLRAERDAAEGKVLPARWTIHEGVWVRTVAHRTDLEITVHRGVSNDSIPFARIVTYHAAGNAVKRIEAKTILAAIEAAEAWLKENLE